MSQFETGCRMGWILVLAAACAVGSARAQAPAPRTLIDQYCVGCHNAQVNTAGLALDTADVGNPAANLEVWERVVRKLRARMMPPLDAPRPAAGEYEALTSYLETALDDAAERRPNPGRVATFRRLTRTEYRNAVRDLLAIEIDVEPLLPADDSSFGFDNVTVETLPPTLLERYLTAAGRISRMALGNAGASPGSHIVTLPADLTQERHMERLPLGTRGGARVRYTFPRDGEYEIEVRLSRDRNENVEGLTEPHQLEIAVDGARAAVFTIRPNRNQMGVYYADEDVDAHLHVRVPVQAGPHEVTAAFLGKNSALVETERQPYQAHFNMDRHPRVQPAVRTVAINGPFNAGGAGTTPSRDPILVCRPESPSRETACAEEIVSGLARRAYRRELTAGDVDSLMSFYREGRGGGTFETGIENAVRAILASPDFLFRIELDPDGADPGAAYRVSDVELASRMSFFLWSSVPDDELLDLAVEGRLRQPGVLERQVRRMLVDPRAEAVVTNFASQWLYLRNLDAAAPNARLFPDFDDNLRRAFRRETQLFFHSVMAEDRSVLDLLTADYTFLNERLAKHYGVPNVYGSRFRRVALRENGERRGLLGHGSILTVTSYATRTSPVLRGQWILENILGTPPPAPPAAVPPLEESAGGAGPLPMRERMARHRGMPACTGCHQLMDPAGLSMENFDAIGRWRSRDESRVPIDASGSLPDGQVFEGVSGLRQALVARPEMFVGAMTEKMLTYALGRGLEHYDRTAVRKILRAARSADYRFSSLVLGVVTSTPFQMRNPL